jgi:hypothetical protein
VGSLQDAQRMREAESEVRPLIRRRLEVSSDLGRNGSRRAENFPLRQMLNFRNRRRTKRLDETVQFEME